MAPVFATALIVGQDVCVSTSVSTRGWFWSLPKQTVWRHMSCKGQCWFQKIRTLVLEVITALDPLGSTLLPGGFSDVLKVGRGKRSWVIYAGISCSAPWCGHLYNSSDLWGFQSGYRNGKRIRPMCGALPWGRSTSPRYWHLLHGCPLVNYSREFSLTVTRQKQSLCLKE